MIIPLVFSFALAVAPASPVERRIEQLAHAAHCQVGVSAVSLGSDQRIEVGASTPLKMASTFKVPLAIAILEQVDRGTLSLDQGFPMTPADFRTDSPISDDLAPKGGGTVSLRALLTRMIQDSDNAAADKLLPLVGGPAGLSARLREVGLGDLHVDRSELDMALAYNDVVAPRPFSLAAYRALVDAKPRAQREAAARRYEQDGKDLGTANAMTRLLVRLAKHDPALLSAASTDWLLDTMKGTRTGKARLRAGVPPGAELAHKTGSAGEMVNDMGLITLPDGRRLAVTVFVRGQVAWERRERLVADIARALVEAPPAASARGK